MLKPIRHAVLGTAVLAASLVAYRLAGFAGAVSVLAVAIGAWLGFGRRPLPAATPVRTASEISNVELPLPVPGRDSAGRAAHGRNQPAPAVHLYQIAYSDETRVQPSPDIQNLDNLSGRPDWREYGPMRSFLLGQALDDDAYYGFFSPKFTGRAKLEYAEVKAFVQDDPDGADVYLFSPGPDFGAFFLNPFEQFDFALPGFTACSQDFLDHIGLDVDLRCLVADSRQTVFSNYIVARPAFWRAWLELNEKLYALCEGADGPLKQALTRSTGYPGGVEIKVFLMERTASLLLARDGRWRTRAYDTYKTEWSSTPLREFSNEAILCDALKTALREQGFPHYRLLYESTRRDAMAAYEQWAT